MDRLCSSSKSIIENRGPSVHSSILTIRNDWIEAAASESVAQPKRLPKLFEISFFDAPTDPDRSVANLHGDGTHSHPMSARIFARTSDSCSGDTRPLDFAFRLRQSRLFT